MGLYIKDGMVEGAQVRILASIAFLRQELGYNGTVDEGDICTIKMVDTDNTISLREDGNTNGCWISSDYLELV